MTKVTPIAIVRNEYQARTQFFKNSLDQVQMPSDQAHYYLLCASIWKPASKLEI